MNKFFAHARPMKLAILTPSISHFEVPLFRLLASREDISLRVFFSEAVERQRFDSQYAQTIDWGGDLLAGYESERVESTSALGEAARRWNADVMLLYGYGWTGAPRLILRNWLRCMPQIHRGTLNFHFDPRRPIIGRILRPFGRRLLGLFDAHHYGGEYSRKVLLDAGARPEALFFVPYAVDTPYFVERADSRECVEGAQRIRQRLGWSQDDHVILFIAQHNWFKGPDIALETFRRVAVADSKARLLVVGSGGMTEQLKESARSEIDQGSVHFAGFIPSLDTVPYYLASDLVLCASRYETWARMINEAMLCRRPCLVSRVVPACGGLVEHKVNGWIVDKPESSLLSVAATEFFALCEGSRMAMGEAARDRAVHFAYEPHVENAVAAVRYALERHVNSSGAAS